MNEAVRSADYGHVVGGPIPGSSAIALRTSGVQIAFGPAANRHIILDSLDLVVPQGQFLCIVGRSGCGKTSLLRLFAGLMTPTSGEVFFDGQRIDGASRERAIVFQDYTRALLPWRTIWANVALALELEGVPRGERRDRSYALLEKVGLSAVGEYYPQQLSGGMQQRVQIARCLAQSPKLLLLDEPFGALDAMTRQSLQDEISNLVADQGSTAIFITHDLEEAIYLGDRVILLSGTPAGITADITIDLPRPRNQLTTREDPKFLVHRHHLFELLAH